MRTVLLLAAASISIGAFAACGDDDNGGGNKTASPPGSPAGAASATQAKTSVATQAAATPSGGNQGGQARVPADACALLTADDVAKLSATAGPGKKLTPSAAPGQSITACRWEWPEGVSTLDVTVMTIPAGVTADQLKSSFRAEIKANGKELTGVGDFAVVESPIAADAKVRILAKGLEMDVELNGLGARDKQEQLITAAKAAVGRLP